MAHQVKMEAHVRDVLNKDVTFHVKNDGGVLGTLMVSKGGVEWRPAHKSVKTIRMNWRQFAKAMTINGG